MPESGEWTTIGENIRQARLGAGMSQASLADRVALDRTMIAKIESGTRRVDALELTRLASALDVPVDHLLEPMPAVISHRAEPITEDSDTDTARRSQRVQVVISARLRDVRQLIDAGTLQPTSPLSYHARIESPEHARDAARWLRARHGLGDDPVQSMLELCERSGQFTLVSELPGDGASLIDGDVAVAVVSSEGDPGRRRATAAHELGHLILGDEYSSDLAVHLSRDDRESLINAFAAELLLPLRALRASDTGDARTREDLIRVAARYRTSWSLALRQAELAQWIDASTSRRWQQVTPTRAEFMEAVGWSPIPDLDGIRVPPGYSHAVMEAWRRNLLSDRRAVELLHGSISIEELPPRDDEELEP